jgi:uncharacterized protein (TIGR00369 family)
MSDGRTELSQGKRAEVVASFERQGFLRELGARIVTLSGGHCVVELPFSEAVSQQHGLFHGGAIGAIADTAGGYAAMTLAPEGVDVLSAEYKINFLRPAFGQTIVADGVVLKAGRSLTITRVDVWAVDGSNRRLCAAVQQSIARAHSRSPGSD